MIQAAKDKASGSYTGAGAHTTAAAVGKTYADEFAPSGNADKRPGRGDDGHLTSAAYAASSPALADTVTPEAVRIDSSHPLEWWAARRPFRSRFRPASWTSYAFCLERGCRGLRPEGATTCCAQTWLLRCASQATAPKPEI